MWMNAQPGNIDANRAVQIPLADTLVIVIFLGTNSTWMAKLADVSDPFVI